MATRTGYVGTQSAGDVLTSANFSKLPGGWVAEVVQSADHTGITTTSDITGASVTVTLVSGRKYRISYCGSIVATASGGSVGLDLYDSTTKLQISRVTTTGNVETAAAYHTMDGDGASHTLKLKLDVISAGTYTVYSTAASGYTTRILVEDIGPTS